MNLLILIFLLLDITHINAFEIETFYEQDNDAETSEETGDSEGRMTTHDTPVPSTTTSLNLKVNEAITVSVLKHDSSSSKYGTDAGSVRDQLLNSTNTNESLQDRYIEGSKNEEEYNIHNGVSSNEIFSIITNSYSINNSSKMEGKVHTMKAEALPINTNIGANINNENAAELSTVSTFEIVSSSITSNGLTFKFSNSKDDKAPTPTFPSKISNSNFETTTENGRKSTIEEKVGNSPDQELANADVGNDVPVVTMSAIDKTKKVGENNDTNSNYHKTVTEDSALGNVNHFSIYEFDGDNNEFNTFTVTEQLNSGTFKISTLTVTDITLNNEKIRNHTAYTENPSKFSSLPTNDTEMSGSTFTLKQPNIESTISSTSNSLILADNKEKEESKIKQIDMPNSLSNASTSNETTNSSAESEIVTISTEFPSKDFIPDIPPKLIDNDFIGEILVAPTNGTKHIDSEISTLQNADLQTFSTKDKNSETIAFGSTTHINNSTLEVFANSENESSMYGMATGSTQMETYSSEQSSTATKEFRLKNNETQSTQSNFFLHVNGTENTNQTSTTNAFLDHDEKEPEHKENKHIQDVVKEFSETTNKTSIRVNQNDEDIAISNADNKFVINNTDSIRHDILNTSEYFNEDDSDTFDKHENTTVTIDKFEESISNSSNVRVETKPVHTTEHISKPILTETNVYTETNMNQIEKDILTSNEDTKFGKHDNTTINIYKNKENILNTSNVNIETESLHKPENITDPMLNESNAYTETNEFAESLNTVQTEYSSIYEAKFHSNNSLEGFHKLNNSLSADSEGFLLKTPSDNVSRIDNIGDIQIGAESDVGETPSHGLTNITRNDLVIPSNRTYTTVEESTTSAVNKHNEQQTFSSSGNDLEHNIIYYNNDSNVDEVSTATNKTKHNIDNDEDHSNRSSSKGNNSKNMTDKDATHITSGVNNKQETYVNEGKAKENTIPNDMVTAGIQMQSNSSANCDSGVESKAGLLENTTSDTPTSNENNKFYNPDNIQKIYSEDLAYNRTNKYDGSTVSENKLENDTTINIDQHYANESNINITDSFSLNNIFAPVSDENMTLIPRPHEPQIISMSESSIVTNLTSELYNNSNAVLVSSFDNNLILHNSSIAELRDFSELTESKAHVYIGATTPSSVASNVSVTITTSPHTNLPRDKLEIFRSDAVPDYISTDLVNITVTETPKLVSSISANLYTSNIEEVNASLIGLSTTSLESHSNMSSTAMKATPPSIASAIPVFATASNLLFSTKAFTNNTDNDTKTYSKSTMKPMINTIEALFSKATIPIDTENQSMNIGSNAQLTTGTNLFEISSSNLNNNTSKSNSVIAVPENSMIINLNFDVNQTTIEALSEVEIQPVKDMNITEPLFSKVTIPIATGSESMDISPNAQLPNDLLGTNLADVSNSNLDDNTSKLNSSIAVPENSMMTNLNFDINQTAIEALTEVTIQPVKDINITEPLFSKVTTPVATGSESMDISPNAQLPNDLLGTNLADVSNSNLDVNTSKLNSTIEVPESSMITNLNFDINQTAIEALTEVTIQPVKDINITEPFFSKVTIPIATGSESMDISPNAQLSNDLLGTNLADVSNSNLDVNTSKLNSTIEVPESSMITNLNFDINRTAIEALTEVTIQLVKDINITEPLFSKVTTPVATGSESMDISPNAQLPNDLLGTNLADVSNSNLDVNTSKLNSSIAVPENSMMTNLNFDINRTAIEATGGESMDISPNAQLPNDLLGTNLADVSNSNLDVNTSKLNSTIEVPESSMITNLNFDINQTAIEALAEVTIQPVKDINITEPFFSKVTIPIATGSESMDISPNAQLPNDLLGTNLADVSNSDLDVNTSKLNSSIAVPENSMMTNLHFDVNQTAIEALTEVTTQMVKGMNTTEAILSEVKIPTVTNSQNMDVSLNAQVPIDLLETNLSYVSTSNSDVNKSKLNSSFAVQENFMMANLNLHLTTIEGLTKVTTPVVTDINATTPTTNFEDDDEDNISAVSSSVTPEVDLNSPDTSDAEFMCEASGKFPDPEKCNIYHVCMKLYVKYAHVLIKCPSGMLYDSKTKKCTRKPVHCPTDVTLSCTTSGIFPHPNYRNRYYKCFWRPLRRVFVLWQFRCPPHMKYDPQKQVCVKKTSLPTCGGNSCEEDIEEDVTEAPFFCTEMGRFPVEYSCRDFYECKEKKGVFQQKLRTCSIGKLFDRELGQCRSSILVFCPFDFDYEDFSGSKEDW